MKAEGWLREHAPESMWTQGASSSIMFAYLSQRMIRNMLLGTLLAFGLIALVLIAALRNLKLGALSLVPNMFPAAVTLGIWAILAAGFAVLATSGFAPNQQLGTLSGITIVVAVVLDFFLLPPLLMLLEGGDTRAAQS